MSFKLSKDVNPPTVFLARKSELGDRFDPEMVLFRRKAKAFKYPAEKLKVFFREAPQYGAGERGLERENDEQPRYIRITDIDEFGILKNELGATATTVEPRYVLDEDDLLIARSGNTVGKSYIHKKDHTPDICFFAGYLIRFRFRCDEILPDYAFAFTQLPHYKEWVRAVQRAAGQPNINAQEYSNLEIPAAPIPVQKIVVALLKNAYAAKRRLEDEAKSLLASIDDLLLAELGIPPPIEPGNMLENRMFRRNFSEVTGNRFDPFYNYPSYAKHDHTIEEHAAFSPIRSLGMLIRGVVYSSTDERDEGQRVLRANNIDISTGDLDLGDLVHIREDFEFNARQRLELGDILICAASGSKEHAGKVAYIDKNIDAFFGGFMMVLRCSQVGVIPEYLAYYMQSGLFRRSIFRHLGGTNINNLSISMVQNLGVIIPNKSEQKRILEKIRDVKLKARSLRAQAQADLEQAKRNIEALILGEPTEAT